jgi:hypothetical protein
MNARIDIDDTAITVRPRGLDVVWTTRRRITVPLEHVRGARIDPDVVRHGPWLGAGYTDALLDYTVAAGPMIVHGRHEFWDVHFPERTVVVELADEPYDRLVVDVDDPQATAAEINAAVGARAAAQAA